MKRKAWRAWADTDSRATTRQAVLETKKCQLALTQQAAPAQHSTAQHSTAQHSELTCSDLGTLSGLNLRGARSIGRYSESVGSEGGGEEWGWCAKWQTVQPACPARTSGCPVQPSAALTRVAGRSNAQRAAQVSHSLHGHPARWLLARCCCCVCGPFAGCLARCCCCCCRRCCCRGACCFGAAEAVVRVVPQAQAAQLEGKSCLAPLPLVGWDELSCRCRRGRCRCIRRTAGADACCRLLPACCCIALCLVALCCRPPLLLLAVLGIPRRGERVRRKQVGHPAATARQMACWTRVGQGRAVACGLAPRLHSNRSTPSAVGVKANALGLSPPHTRALFPTHPRTHGLYSLGRSTCTHALQRKWESHD